MEDFPYPIYNAFQYIYDKLPILDLQGRNGHTDYIDFIKPDDMEFSIMKGIDLFKRPFISLKVNINNKETVGTFFQRYSDCNKNWAFGSKSYDFAIYHDSRLRNEDYDFLEKRLKLLLNGEIIYNIDLYKDDYKNEKGNGELQVKLV